MSNPVWSAPINCPLPIVLVRGFGGTDTVDERKMTYQGFNDGSVYPQKRGENYIYEGLILRFMKSDWRFQDATNVIGYYGSDLSAPPVIPAALEAFDPSFFQGKVIIDPAMALRLLQSKDDPHHSLWVFRYYDLRDREFAKYGEALTRLIDFIRALAEIKNGSKPKVNIIAHSMGGLIVREAIQRTYPKRSVTAADEAINKVVTLGTPHKGILFQVLKDLHWLGIESANELEHFNPENQESPDNAAGYQNFAKCFPLDRLLTVVGTNYKAYGNGAASVLNRLFSVAGEFGMNYNRSDGLVKQDFAQIPGAPRTFVHKPHGGFDSLISARESFEVATRFFFGNVRVRLRQVRAQVERGSDWFGKSEFFFGVAIKPRGVDFELFHQSREAENCYGPFRTKDFSDSTLSFGWAGSNQLIWEGYLNSAASTTQTDMVMRMEFYVGERDLFGIGFSDNIVFTKQYYVRAILQPTLQLYLYTGEEFANRKDALKTDVNGPGDSVNLDKKVEDDSLEKATLMRRVADGWEFDIGGTGFSGTYRLEFDRVSEEGAAIGF